MDYPSGCQSEERYTYAQSIHLCLFTVLFGENMLHVLLALLVLHFELMQFILIYDNCLKSLLSIFPFIKKLFTQGEEQEGKWIPLHGQVEESSGLCLAVGIVP